MAEGYEKKVRALQRNIDSLGKQVYALQAQNGKLRSGGAAQGALEVDGEASAVRFAEELRSLRNFSDKRALADEKRINDLGTEKRELQRQLGASETEAARWKEKCLSIEKKLAFANEALVKLACERDGIAYNANMSRMQHRDELASLESRLENAEHDNGELRRDHVCAVETLTEQFLKDIAEQNSVIRKHEERVKELEGECGSLRFFAAAETRKREDIFAHQKQILSKMTRIIAELVSRTSVGRAVRNILRRVQSREAEQAMEIKALNEIIRGRSESNNKEEADLAETLGKMTEAAEAAKSSLKFANVEAARLRAALKTCEELGAKMYRNEIDASAAFECTQCELTLERSSTLIPCGHKFCFLCFDETEKDAKGLTKCPACGQSATAVVQKQ